MDYVTLLLLCNYDLFFKLHSGIGNRKTPCTDKINPGLIPYLPREKRWGRACHEQMGSYSLALVGGTLGKSLGTRRRCPLMGGWIDLQDLEG